MPEMAKLVRKTIIATELVRISEKYIHENEHGTRKCWYSTRISFSEGPFSDAMLLVVGKEKNADD